MARPWFVPPTDLASNMSIRSMGYHEKFNRHDLCMVLSSPTHPANGDLSAPWLSLDVFGSPPEVIWMFLANLQPPWNIMEQLASSETGSPKSTCSSTSSEENNQLLPRTEMGLSGDQRWSSRFPGQGSVCPTHGFSIHGGAPYLQTIRFVYPHWWKPPHDLFGGVQHDCDSQEAQSQSWTALAFWALRGRSPPVEIITAMALFTVIIG